MSFEKAKILLIEDDPGIAETLKRVLAEEGYQVIVERRGDEGLARSAKEPFQLVITDLKLPGLSGLDLVRQLHSAQPRLPIILVTAFGTTETAIEAMKFGAFDYVLKPFDIGKMIELVAKAADSNRGMSEPVALGETGMGRAALVGRGPAMQAIFKETKIPVQTSETRDKATVAIIFERVNRQGVELDTLQLLINIDFRGQLLAVGLT